MAARRHAPATGIQAMWSEQKLVASDGNAQEWFGSWVEVDGDLALISAKNATVNGRAGQGAVYLAARRSNGHWTIIQKIVAHDGEAGALFGSAVAFHDGIAIVTAPYATVAGKTWHGAAYFYTLVGSRLVMRQKIVPAGGVAFDSFGTAVAFNATSAFVGAGGVNRGGQYMPRKVYTFDFDPTQVGTPWMQAQTLPAPVPDDPLSSFGGAIAMADDLALVGARGSTLGLNVGQGIVYAYERRGAQWELVQKVTATDGAARDNYGISIATDGTTALIGAQGATIEGRISNGAVYRLERGHTGWNEKQKLVPTPGGTTNLFGASVRMAANTALIGAYGADGYQGAAYVFQKAAGTWKQTLRLQAGDGANGDCYGYYTALDARTAIVGAYTAKVGTNANQGAAYFYARPHFGSPG